MSRKSYTPQAKERYWIGYCRKSTDAEDRQVHTLQDQAAMIQAYYDRLPAAEREGRPLQLLQEAQSAYRPGRPVFGRLLQMASRGAVQGVIVVHPNRVSRNHSDSGAFVQRLVDRQIASLDTAGGKRYTGADSNDIFMLTLEGAMSWKDSRDKGDRILQAMRMRAGEGRHMGRVPIGYRFGFRPEGDKVLEVDPERAPLLRRLFEMAAAGAHSTRDLEAEAWRMGLRSRGGKKIGKPCIHKLLCNPFFKGHVQFQGVVTKGAHEPIVDEALWERVQGTLRGRRTGTARPKNLTIQDLFVFGNLLECPGCGRHLCPYRVKERYVYYECKNPETRCRVCVPQAALAEQLPSLLADVILNPEEVEELRGGLLSLHRRRGAGEVGRQRAVNRDYEGVLREIGDVFARRKEAEALGILEAVDLHLGELKKKRDDLQAQLSASGEEGTAWVERVIRTFELAGLLQEAILYGSRRPRELALTAIASNLSVEGEKLVVKLRSPFRGRSLEGGRREWWSFLYDVRTEIADTYSRLENAVCIIEEEDCLQHRGIATVGQLCGMSADALLAGQSWREVTLIEVRARLSALGLALRDDLPPSPPDR
jgi:DNA invertase Pin-like site-specific DNA recombinase